MSATNAFTVMQPTYAALGVAAFPTSHARQMVREPDDEKRRAGALRLWEEAADPTGSPVDRYLSARRVSLPHGAAGRAIRWHPACPFGPSTHLGCMLALVRDIATDQPLGIQRTALDKNGCKLKEHGSNGRLSLGRLGGGAVKLTADEDLGLSVAIGEGLESTLSLRNLCGCTELAVWSLLSAPQLKEFPVLDGIETLWVAVDHDRAGIMAARHAADRWQKAGREVLLIATKSKGEDLNDLAVRHA